MTYPLRLTADQWQDVGDHYADDWPAGDELLDELCATGAPCDGHCGDAGCPVYEQAMRCVHAEPVDLDDTGADAIPF